MTAVHLLNEAEGKTGKVTSHTPIQSEKIRQEALGAERSCSA